MRFRQLLRLADSGSLERGRRYAERGLVEIVPSARNGVDAVVRGSMSLDANLRVQLLQARAQTHPAEVFDEYVSLIEETLTQADQQRYAQAVSYLRDLRRAAGAAGLQRQYAEFVGGLLETHRRRPKLISMLMRLPAT